MKTQFLLSASSLLHVIISIQAFSPPPTQIKRYANNNIHSLPSTSHYSSTNNNEDEASLLRQKAQNLRDQVAQLESLLDETRPRRPTPQSQSADPQTTQSSSGRSLKNKRILITGANGRLGSMIARQLLRSHPEVKEVVAAVHYVGEATTRGYGRLSYEVGAEDGRGSIGAAWSDERNASFEYDEEIMGGYNLNKLRVVEVELLNPTQVRTITEDVDAVIFCATDFEGNRPRAVAGFNAALLFRAVADPLKGRVEIEGVRNCLEGLLSNIKDAQYKNNLAGVKKDELASKGPTQFILISSTPDAFSEFDTPFGEFNGLKRQSEYIVANEFPSISHCILQMGRYDERVCEGLEIYHEEALDDTEIVDGVIGAKQQPQEEKPRSIWEDDVIRKINRRDAARAAVEALLDEDLENLKVQCYTYRR